VTGQNWLWLVGYGGLLTALTLTSLYLALDWLGFSEARAVTVSFLTLGFTQLAHVFNMADVSGSAWRNEVTRNASLWLALGLCSLLLIAATYTPVLSSALGCVNPGFQGWGLVLVATLLTPVLGWAARRFVPRFRW
jgi:Ca2+-transporting ATPase